VVSETGRDVCDGHAARANRSNNQRESLVIPQHYIIATFRTSATDDNKPAVKRSLALDNAKGKESPR
jgi:hypothetical protein